jgi:hypothetical protein
VCVVEFDVASHRQVADYKQRIARLDALRGTPEGAAEGLVATSSSTSSPVDATGELGGFVSEIPELQVCQKESAARR